MLKSIRFSKIVKLLQSGKWISGTQQNRKYCETGSLEARKLIRFDQEVFQGRSVNSGK